MDRSSVGKRPRGRPPKAKKPVVTGYECNEVLEDSDSFDQMPSFSISPSPTQEKKKKRSTGISGKQKDGVLIVKGNWTDSEDNLLRELVELNGMSHDQRSLNNTRWSEIARHLPGRVGKQCRERWHNHLRPDINKGGWSLHEEITIYVCWRRWASQWARISRILKNRSDNRVKNHWNCHMCRFLKQDYNYFAVLHAASKQFTHLLPGGRNQDDDADIERIRADLFPRITRYISENTAAINQLQSSGPRLPDVPVTSHDVGMYQSYQEIVKGLNCPERNVKKTPPASKPPKKERNPKKRKISVEEPVQIKTEQIYEDLPDTENGYLGSQSSVATMVPLSQFSVAGMEMYGKQDQAAVSANASQNGDFSEMMENQVDYSYMDYTNYSIQPSAAYASFVSGSENVDLALEDEGPLLTASDPFWTKAVTKDYCSSFSSPSPSKRRTTSTPVRNHYYDSSVFASGSSGFRSPLSPRKRQGTSFALSPIQNPQFDESIWFDMKSDSSGLSPLKHELSSVNFGLMTPPAIRKAMSSSYSLTPEDLGSPNRMLRDATELIEVEMKKSPLKYGSPLLEKCRRKLDLDHWTPVSSNRPSSSSFNSSGYGSFHATPQSS